MKLYFPNIYFRGEAQVVVPRAYEQCALLARHDVLSDDLPACAAQPLHLVALQLGSGVAFVAVLVPAHVVAAVPGKPSASSAAAGRTFR